ncbi:hypothetical protein AVEN_243850-1 [Araneus ventricosus]|uniref:Uncharacterized protein n=1 Tax=Araneus ventricosus TaxID=182803 RepID=A0A4Y2A5C6_ARAVE|nr:hypothetical protein AVEN_243850-1 [Araneus ventricosus]
MKHYLWKGFCLVISTYRFEATRGLFWGRPRDHELRSDYEDNICVVILLSKLPHHTNEVTLTHDVRYRVHEAHGVSLSPYQTAAFCEEVPP